MELDTITLVSYEGQDFIVSSLLLNYSSVLSCNLNIDAPNLHDKIHLSNLEIDSESLEIIISYFSHYNFSPPTILLEKSRSLTLLKLIPSWDIQFIDNIPDEVLIKLVHACFRLAVSPLLELLCIKLAARYKDAKVVETQHKVSFEQLELPEVQAFLKIKFSWATMN
jgi:hypothetical protein